MQKISDDFTLVSQHLVMTEHLNPNHVIFGGQLLAWLDKDLYIFVSSTITWKTINEKQEGLNFNNRVVYGNRRW